MTRIARAAAIAAALSLGGCTMQQLDDFNAFVSSLPQPTPEEQCALDGSRWDTVVTYDANGNATTGGTCTIPDSGDRDHHDDHGKGNAR